MAPGVNGFRLNNQTVCCTLCGLFLVIVVKIIQLKCLCKEDSLLAIMVGCAPCS
jgi:hypothetical protein